MTAPSNQRKRTQDAPTAASPALREEETTRPTKRNRSTLSLGKYWAVLSKKKNNVLDAVAFETRAQAETYIGEVARAGVDLLLCNCAVHDSFVRTLSASDERSRVSIFCDVSDSAIRAPDSTRAALLVSGDKMEDLYEALLMRAHARFCQAKEPHSEYEACLLGKGFRFVIEPVRLA